jgi:hypothetical protein
VSVLWRHAVSEQLVRTDLSESQVKGVTRALTPGMAGHVVMIDLGALFPIAAVVGYLGIALHIIVPFGAPVRGRAGAG